MNVVIVESPAKAKTINKYLGSDYKVLASYGHVRDLPAKDGSVRPDEDFDMSWEVDAKAAKRLSEIAAALSLSPKTISVYRARVLEKLGVENNVEIARYAVRHGVVDAGDA